MSSPPVSIFIPAYNAGRYIASTLDSLLSQTFRDFEIVIVNDGSQDNTLEIARTVASSDTRLRIVSHEQNKGLSAARNTGWANVSLHSHFIMNHDADDVSLPRKLEHLVNYLQTNPGVAAVGSLSRYINEAEEEVGWPSMEWKPEAIRRTFGELNSMAISATLVRRVAYETVAPFRSEFGGCDDYDFWARMLLAGFELANIPRVLHHIRVHSASMGSTGASEMAAHTKLIARRYNQSLGTGIESSLKNMVLSKSRSVRMRAKLQLSNLRRDS